MSVFTHTKKHYWWDASIQKYPRCLAGVLRLCSCSLSPSLVPYLQQSSHPMCQSCLKKNGALCLLHCLPCGCLLLPDQIRRNQKTKAASHLKTYSASSPCTHLRGALWQTGHDGQWTGCRSLQHALAGGDVFHCVFEHPALVAALQGILPNFFPIIFKCSKY